MGALEGARLTSLGTSERATLVTQELTLDEPRRHGTTVDDHERRGATRTLLIQSRRGQLLAGTRFAADEHRRVRRHEAAQLREDGAHRHRAAEQVAKAIFVGQLALAALVEQLQAQLRLAEPHRGLAGHIHGLDAMAVDERTVGRASVAHEQAMIRALHLRVHAAHGGIGELKITADGAAHEHRIGAQLDAPPALGTASHFDEQMANATLRLVARNDLRAGDELDHGGILAQHGGTHEKRECRRLLLCYRRQAPALQPVPQGKAACPATHIPLPSGDS